MKSRIVLIIIALLPSFIVSQDFDFSKIVQEVSSNNSTIVAPQKTISDTSAATSAAYKWLVLVFLTGTNDLGILDFASGDVNEMEKVGSDDKVAVLVEYNALTSDAGNLRFQRGSKTYFIKKDDDTENITSPVIDSSSNGDMGSWKHLSIFARKMIARYKAEKIMLIVWNHGNGRLGIAYDDVSKNHMEIQELGYALKEISSFAKKKIDIFATDACLMQMAEVVYELKDYAQIIIGSQEYIPGPGYPYDDLINILKNHSDAEEAALLFVNAYYLAYQNGKSEGYDIPNKSHTLSAIRTSEVNNFAAALNQWVEALMVNKADFEEVIKETYTESAFYFGPTGLNEAGLRSVDLVDYLLKIKDRVKSKSAKESTISLINSIKAMKINDKAGDGKNRQNLIYKDHSNGLSIYLPLLRYNANNYEKLAITRDTLWDDFIREMLIMRQK